MVTEILPLRDNDSVVRNIGLVLSYEGFVIYYVSEVMASQSLNRDSRISDLGSSIALWRVSNPGCFTLQHMAYILCVFNAGFLKLVINYIRKKYIIYCQIVLELFLGGLA